MFALVELRNFKGYKMKTIKYLFSARCKMTKHVYFTKLMYFLKLQTIKMLKRKILFNIFFAGTKLSSNCSKWSPQHWELGRKGNSQMEWQMNTQL